MYKDVIEFIRETFGEKERDIPLHAPCFVGNEKNIWKNVLILLSYRV